ncbi:colanic acid biosynthesis acetyltransferase WcaF [Chitinophaga oryzae]|uniref:Colanic acid biosynthesis acetyltransferase WcaF n=1 Tax=Chitinophaga oryzae TaxID=2725414 RepID=A0AAE6ZEH7_9BACT|nr:WcaF family extracellular polysaccharide biosynthesis acetyltransferase [Chitinophaga oryzae]QJB30580.1 colanic acid biosynthesis acetyltransferase WcaF [Chitinophaga oryzae]QJB37079.1 colanic acid biosynthesis acetyltransferase WcaF [Chitinophaga oryzae]
MKTNLAAFNTGTYHAGPKWKVLAWYFCNYYVLNSALPWPYAMKRGLLRLFGATIGKGLVIKTKVRIKYPWRLTIGDHCWLGEGVWIDNLEDVTLGDDVCISQGALLLTGNHDYKRPDFPYRLGKIHIESGAWIGAMAVVCAGVTCGSHSVLTVNAVASRDLQPWMIYSGNPALPVRTREMTSHSVTFLNAAAI